MLRIDESVLPEIKISNNKSKPTQEEDGWHVQVIKIENIVR